MIAEYERAQILERSRRGKRHRARQGQVSVLSGAPYGYRYVRKRDNAVAYYEILAAEASVVRMVYDRYTVDAMSIGGITRLLNEQGVPTRKQISRWERSTVVELVDWFVPDIRGVDHTCGGALAAAAGDAGGDRRSDRHRAEVVFAERYRRHRRRRARIVSETAHSRRRT